MTMDEMIVMYKGLIYKIANKFYNVSKEDLFQAGSLGLLKAYKNYQKNGETKFSTYAYEYIFGEMYQMVYKNQSLKISKDALKMYQKIEMTRSALAQRIHKIPSNQEVADFLEWNLETVEQIILAGSTIMTSLDETNKDSERDYYETIGQEETLSTLDNLTLQESFEELNKEEKKIIAYRYFNDLTQREVAEKLNMTQVMVSRYEKKGISKLRAYYDVAS